jgi:hypothetical protein
MSNEYQDYRKEVAREYRQELEEIELDETLSDYIERSNYEDMEDTDERDFEG